jgi:hypothetical protein
VEVPLVPFAMQMVLRVVLLVRSFAYFTNIGRETDSDTMWRAKGQISQAFFFNLIFAEAVKGQYDSRESWIWETCWPRAPFCLRMMRLLLRAGRDRHLTSFVIPAHRVRSSRRHKKRTSREAAKGRLVDKKSLFCRLACPGLPRCIPSGQVGGRLCVSIFWIGSKPLTGQFLRAYPSFPFANTHLYATDPLLTLTSTSLGFDWTTFAVFTVSSASF